MRVRGSRHPSRAILRLTLPGLACGQTTMAYIAIFARMNWETLNEPLGFVRDQLLSPSPSHGPWPRFLTSIFRGALTGWLAQVEAEQQHERLGRL